MTHKRDQEILGLLDESVSSLVFWAFRYFLPRQSIHAAFFADRLPQVMPLLDARDRNRILRETRRELSRNLYDWPTDVRATWDRVAAMGEGASED